MAERSGIQHLGCLYLERRLFTVSLNLLAHRIELTSSRSTKDPLRGSYMAVLFESLFVFFSL